MTVDVVPEVTSLDDVYATIDQSDRYRRLFDLFATRFGGEKPDFVARSPGRVNLIGEHIDYCYFAVLPMAVENDIVMLVRVTGANNSKVELTNSDSRFADAVFEIAQDGSPVEIDKTQNSWVNYFKCGFLVAQQALLRQQQQQESSLRPAVVGLQVLVDGTVPAASGLSSSAAFVCSAALATLRSNRQSDAVTKHELTKLAIVSEQHVGVFSGGMDQSASVFGQRDHALYVQFRPELKCTPFRFPDTDPGLTFLIANSLVTANKHLTAPVNYNLRVVEVAIAAEVLARKFGVDLVQDGGIGTGTLRGFLDAYYDKVKNAQAWDGNDTNQGRERLRVMQALVDEVFTRREGYTTEQAAELLGTTVEKLTDRFLTKTPVRYVKLQLHGRAHHVYAEARRVLDYLSLLLAPPQSSDDLFAGLGELMNQSHHSLATEFNASCAELDQICEIALAHGSKGSRVTGAGFGGCTVHLVPADKVERVKKALVEEYYKVRFTGISQKEIDDALVVSKPGIGSLIYTGGRP
ncbi:ribosomal protein S5 domain 2-type protein [Lipomyces japonicus]|uniref:ribosomal protein S5 domain 2-type protein n=1 Tax=Lipomyces japonicus TaxID=56871 RepID=UPI0034D00A56